VNAEWPKPAESTAPSPELLAHQAEVETAEKELDEARGRLDTVKEEQAQAKRELEAQQQKLAEAQATLTRGGKQAQACWKAQKLELELAEARAASFEAPIAEAVAAIVAAEKRVQNWERSVLVQQKHDHVAHVDGIVERFKAIRKAADEQYSQANELEIEASRYFNTFLVDQRIGNSTWPIDSLRTFVNAGGMQKLYAELPPSEPYDDRPPARSGGPWRDELEDDEKDALFFALESLGQSFVHHAGISGFNPPLSQLYFLCGVRVQGGPKFPDHLDGRWLGELARGIPRAVAVACHGGRTFDPGLARRQRGGSRIAQRGEGLQAELRDEGLHRSTGPQGVIPPGAA
jgi:hypothetical protein